jgi:acyl carrier protein
MAKNRSVDQAEERQKIKNIIARIAKVKVEDLLDDIKFREEAGIDSMMGLEILAACERALSISVDEADLADTETIGAFVDLLVELHLADSSSNIPRV